MKRPVAQQAPVSVKEPIREESPLDFFKADSEEKEGACSASSANMTSTPSSPLQPPSQYLPDSQTPSSVDPNHPQVTSSPAGDHGISTRISRKLVPAKIPKGEERDLKDSSGGLEAEVSKKNSSSDVTAEAKIDIAEELSKPASICIESSAEWSEEDETDFMKIFSNVPVVIQDSMGDSQAANAIIDTGSSSSFISKHLTQQYSLLERPLSSEDIQTFGAFADSEHTPTTFVALQLKCSNIGLNEFVRVQVRVLDVEKFDIIFGRPFIQKHGILNNLLTRPQSNGPTKTLFVVQQKDSDDTNTRGTDCATPGDPTTAFRSSCAIPYPSLPEIEESIPNEDPATLFSNSSEHESSSMEESDSDDESVIEFAGQPSFDEILPSAFDVAENEEKLARLLGPMKQAMVDRLMAEFMEIFGQNWTEGTRKCTASPESSQYIAEDKVSSKKSRKDKVKKRSRETEDNESSEEKNGGPPKRHRQKPNPEDSSDTGNSFACPYHVSRVKSHLYRSHMIYQCTRCKDTFRTEEMLKEHSGAAVECERYQLKEAEGVRGVNADIERRLRSRKQDGSPKDRWIKIFTMLFGDNNVPTPYFEPVVEEMNFMGNASSPDSRQLTDFEEYLREELPRAIESNLQRAAQNQLRSIEAGLRRSLHDMIRDSQDEVFSRYRSRIASTGESSSTNPFDGDAPHIRGEQSTHSTALPLSNAETPPQERQLERLGSFFSQPPHQMNPRQSIELSTADTTNPHEDNAFSDSGYQADSVINATDPVTSWNIMDARDPQRLTEIRLRTSKNQESSAIPINDLESDNNLLLTVNGEENRAPEAPMFECPITAEYQPYQMITNYDHEDMWAGVVFEN
ncbi:hypothetical protein G7Y89_g7305 [Cudoniella acicularis]|uniref:C2H2-type domain-containing protein n=1 Tax=Cudoniella acicularis TaxID=354080 RepID=A0A8H4RL67_9HELO|nr:hypothetical protein G7Y89_g7305 [Cudoniella acicularis]